MPELLRSAKLAVEKGVALGRNETYVKQLSDYILPALVEALHKISGPLLDESQVRSIVDEIKQVITASSSRKGERAERTKAEDFDAEEGEMLREENEQEEELFNQGKDKTAEERRIAICIFDDVAEQCREAALKYAHLA
ncbi:ARM repeat superfamily protein [Forsythia ovata]|uniref:ARM repeat superfamily protein n=1 Tax=Forsythia ovata TaxID=205694 RepID=A0ABD1P257_9LAMI